MNFNLRQITSKLSIRGWLAIGGAALVGVIFIFVVMSLAGAPSYTTLTAGQTADQTSKITTALAAAGIQYQLMNNGTGVQVQSSQIGQATDALAQQGLLTGGGSSSFEDLIGKSSLGESNFQQEQQNTSALEQQLDQTLGDITGVTSAQVELAIPDQTSDLFSGINTQTTASVVLQTTGTLSPDTVKAMASTVAGAVAGLDVNKVSITDQDGDPLWPQSGNGDTGLAAKESAQNAYDSQEANAADAYLASTIGPGKALVSVNADLDMNQVTTDSVTYKNSKAPPVTATTGVEKLKGNAGALGAAGNNATNTAASYAGTGTNGTSTYSNDTSTVTNSDNKTVSTDNVAPGSINRQTVAVLVNSTVSPATLAAIKSTVENQVGFNPKRGDKISVNSVAFPKLPVAASSSSSKDLGDLKYVAVGLGSLIFLLFISRLLRKREADDFAGRPTWLRELEMPRSLAELESQTQMVDLDHPQVVARLRSPVNLARQQVEELVDRDPERVAAQIRQWMTED